MDIDDTKNSVTTGTLTDKRLVPTDKTSNNILIVCKNYYLDIVLKELDTSNVTSKHTYTPCSTHVENLVTKQEDFVNSQNIKIPKDMKQLPTLIFIG